MLDISKAYGFASQLAADVNQTQTTIVLPIGHGAQLSPLLPNNYFWLRMRCNGKMEIVKVTGVSGDTLYVTRGQDGTAPQAFAKGCCIDFDWSPTQFCENALNCAGGSPVAIMQAGTYCFDCNTCITVNSAGQITAINGQVTC